MSLIGGVTIDWPSETSELAYFASWNFLTRQRDIFTFHIYVQSELLIINGSHSDTIIYLLKEITDKILHKNNLY